MGEIVSHLFFWGCSKYRSSERFFHDRAIAFRSASVSVIVSNQRYLCTLSDNTLDQLHKMLVEEGRYVKKQPEVTDELISRVKRVCGELLPKTM